MHGPINVKFPNNTSKWQMGFNSAFKGLMKKLRTYKIETTMKYRKFYKGVEELKANYKHKIYKSVDKTGRILLERNKVIE
jgi:hypothetical protein